MVLLFWQVLGLKLAWRKLERGKVVRWIGAEIQIQPEMKIIIVTVPEDKLTQLKDTCKEFLSGKGMVEEKLVRAFAGRGSWLGGLLPQVRPLYKQVWGGLSGTAEERQEAPGVRQAVQTSIGMAPLAGRGQPERPLQKGLR